MQLSIFFCELEPCKHCGGRALEQWRMKKDWKGEEYVAVVMMCNRCTFETSSATSRESRETAVQHWNAGVIQQLAHNMESRLLSFEETWEFETKYMRLERPQLRQKKCASNH
jgi:hypothetical protein